MASGRVFITMIVLACTAAFSSIVSCDDRAGATVEPVKIKGQWFHLELAADNASRIKGLAHREYIAPDGGMLFVFPRPQPLAFVMRHCLVPIDIAYLSGSGRVLAVHHMQVEPPQRPDESDAEYEARLERYPSPFPAPFAIEVAGGRFEEIGLEVGDRVEMDTRRLKRLAR